jgi:hypothetical protein
MSVTPPPVLLDESNARLVFVTDDGLELPATPGRLRKVNIVGQDEVFHRFYDQLERALGITPTPETLGPIRLLTYMVDCAVLYDHDFDDAGSVVAHPFSHEDLTALRAAIVTHQ